MSKVADCKFKWTKSASTNIKKVEVFVNNNGHETVMELGPDVESFVVVVRPFTNITCKIRVTNADGLTAETELYPVTVNDLENPLPPTGLSHELLNVRDEPIGGHPGFLRPGETKE
jgi:hypothetical protein